MAKRGSPPVSLFAGSKYDVRCLDRLRIGP